MNDTIPLARKLRTLSPDIAPESMPNSPMYDNVGLWAARNGFTSA